jgi:hypothetical protein
VAPVTGADMTGVGPHTTSFKVLGVRNGSVVSVTWDQGSVRGDPPTIDLIEIELELADVGRQDPNFTSAGLLMSDGEGDILADPERALGLIRHVLDRVTEIVPLSGDHR